ncbi:MULTISPECIES: helix-turn-helix domain-containing protein [unclassified Neisseria]|uniref:helix-turn-helix domain-containing protein n=1 Tax=unclassified Neisseria TaxID=2623750 RepID=UPI002665E352|nr:MULTISPECIES: helix-turn-helix domain-containing protein [unclassified Neisseria]MDO1509486.1 helix-turn-helix domain-containing protein [Neisseria sp. MVDL19-042950]MDO1515742.1 helix-turn-helix domain-containing protein [Neisseria sp. MVDL18-041461]MDO1563434.1 helix-turn-helix domain-containing protein [Neisseria sp. MVDL20-010259]
MNTYDVEEAAAYCKCHPETIREHIREGRLNASKPGRKYCITQRALDAFLSNQENEQLQASLANRSEEKCLKLKDYIAVGTVSGTLTLQHPAEKELDALLAQKTKNQPKN